MSLSHGQGMFSMRMRRPPDLIVLVLACDVLLTAISLYNALYGAPFYKFGVLFDVDAESNLPTWYSSIQLFAVFLALGFVASRNVVKSNLRTWLFWFLPALFLLFSVDEVAMIHDWLGQQLDAWSPLLDRKNTSFALTGFWGVVVGIPFLVGAGALVFGVRGMFSASPHSYRKVLLGTVVFIAAAAGIDTLQNFVSPSSCSYVLTTHAEEFLELFGISVVLWGAWDLLAALHCSIHLDPRGPIHDGALRTTDPPRR